ncbi:MAG: FtsK/SpoIIIE domain-containing protein [Thermomicrobiales bacterium]
MPNQLELAAEQLKRAHANALGSLDAAIEELASGGQHAEQAAKAALERHVAIARNKSAQQVIQHGSFVRDLGIELVGNPGGPLAAADFVAIGNLSLPGENSGVNADVSAPCVLPLLGRGNIVVDVSEDAGQGLIRHIIREAYAGTAPGQLSVIGYDPLLSGLFAPFASIKTASNSALNVLNRPAEFTQTMDRLLNDVQRVNDLLQGTSDDLLAYHRITGHAIELLQLVVLVDAPEGIDEQTCHQMLSLMKVGPSAGISFVMLTHSKGRGPDWWNQSDVERMAHVVTGKSRNVKWKAHPQFSLALARPDVSDIVTFSDRLASDILSASVPSIPFERIQDVENRWIDSSANGITFAIGTAGSRTIELTLGDEQQQRHNALVTGAVGQGKSNLLKVIVHSICQRYAPSEVDLYMLDFKSGVTLFPFASTPESTDYLPHARVLGLESDRYFGVAVLRHLDAELDRRYKLIRPHGEDISKYRTAFPDAHMPRIVLIIDEFQMLFDPADGNAEEAARLLEGLARRGRSCGVHIILASQTISGIAALMTRENGIFAQFPIRIALKNSIGESYASLAQGNDAAARLRARGEAIVNLDYGTQAANKAATIAVADDTALARLRHSWWKSSKQTTKAPLVFDGARLVRVGEAVTAIKDLRHRILSEGVAPAAIVGYPIDVSETPLGITLSHDPGRNIAILGAGEKSGIVEAGEESSNNAIGILQSASIGLALQHPAGDAEFVCLDLLDPVSARRNNHAGWLSLMERLGYPVQVIGKSDLGTFLHATAERLGDRASEAALYILAFGLDRAANLETPDIFAHRPIEDLQTILRDGPSQGVHLLGWWSNVATFKSHIGFGGEGFFESLIMLRVDQGSVQDFLGPFVTWSVRENRGLVSDRTQLAEPTTVVPFSPLNARDRTILLSQDWET